MKELWRSAWMSLVRRRLRSWVTVCGIAVGTAMVVIISGIGAIGERAVYSELESMGMNGLSVSASDGLTVSCLTSIRRLPTVSQAMPLLLEYSSVDFDGRVFSAVSCGIDAGAEQVISLRRLHGRLLTGEDLSSEAPVCVVDAALAREAFGRENIVGQTLTMVCETGTLDLTVVGVTATGSSLLQNMTSLIPYMVYVPYTTLQSAVGMDTFDQIAVRVADNVEPTQVEQAIVRSLRPMAEEIGTLKTENLSTQRERLERLVTILSLGLTAIGGVSLVVSGCGIMTVMLSAVHERTREIGIKKAMGASRCRIVAEFILGAAILGFFGAASGLVLGITAVEIGAYVIGFSSAWSALRLALIVLLTLLLAVAFGVYPAYTASSLRPVEALRSES